MSGIVGIVDFGGEPIDAAILRSLTDQMTFRGPDRQQVWHDGEVGFGHALLANTFESEHDHQPLTLGNDIWIVTDARIDDQATLIEAIRSHGTIIANGACDAELILRAYHAWGSDCVEHLIGDFAFGIWDARQRRLMLARDHFGVTPMYYAQIGNRLVFGNTLEVVRKYPGIRDDLNETAVGDYLLFGCSIDLENTFFTSVRSVPPASRIVWNDGVETRCQRYWSLPEPDSYHRVRRPADLAAEFKAVLTEAVRDRLRAPRAAISLSGGLDSGAIAMIAGSLRSDGSCRTELHSYSFGYDWMVPETERHYASLTARAAGIEEATYISNEQAMFDGKPLWRSTPEPRLNAARRSARTEVTRLMAAAGERVHITGTGGDVLLGASPLDWRKFFQTGSVMASARALATYSWEQRWVPLNRILWTMRGGVPTNYFTASEFPWLAPDFVRRADLSGRMAKMSTLRAQWKTARHRMAYDPIQAAVLSSGDPEFTRIAAKTYHPLFDLRVVQFMTKVAPFPWFVDKILLREAMRDLLPEPVRKRRKVSPGGAVLRLIPIWRSYEDGEQLAKVPVMSRFVDQNLLLRRVASITNRQERGHNAPSFSGFQQIEIPLCLGYWLKSTFP